MDLIVKVLFQELPTQVEVRRAGDEKSLGDNVIQQLLELSEQVPGTGVEGLSSQDPDVREAVQAAQLHDQVRYDISICRGKIYMYVEPDKEIVLLGQR